VTQQLLGSMSALLTGRLIHAISLSCSRGRVGVGAPPEMNELRKTVEPIALAARKRRILYI
jgi:hypothetical protein